MAYTSDSCTTATVSAGDWITTTYNPTTTTTFDDILTTTTVSTAPSTITITPDALVASPAYTYTPSTSISVSLVGEKELEEKLKKTRDDIDKHVDELEQDLEYLNEQRQALEQTVLNMGDRIAVQDDLIDDLQTKLECAATQIRLLREQQQEFLNNNILVRICDLEAKLYEMDKRDMGQDK